jgi:hypothetical protein
MLLQRLLRRAKQVRDDKIRKILARDGRCQLNLPFGLGIEPDIQAFFRSCRAFGSCFDSRHNCANSVIVILQV